MIEIREVVSPADVALVRELFAEYQAAIGVDLCFQGFQDELASLPGRYARPSGCLLVAWDGDAAIGCVGLRPFEANDCEMKRLYVRPAGRGRGIGRMLAQTVIEKARRAGYRRMLLDTLTTMAEAQALYRSLGFTRVAPYTPNPLAEAVYMARALDGV